MIALPLKSDLAKFQTSDLGNGMTFLVGKVPEEHVWTAEFFDRIWAKHPLEFHEIIMHGKPVKLPRWQDVFVHDYAFSGTNKRAKPLPDILKPLWEWARSETYGGMQGPGVLINYYEGPKHWIGQHHDEHKGLVVDSPIVTISYGEERLFRLTLEGKQDRKTIIVDRKDFPAPNGTVFVMPYATNLAWKHGVPKSTRYTGRRISVTFRAFEE